MDTTRAGTRRRRGVVGVVAAGLVAASAITMPLSSAAAETGTQQLMKCVAEDPYYLHAGEEATGPATFSQDAPVGDNTAPATQTVTGADVSVSEVDTVTVTDAAWTADFTGTLCGDMTLTMYAASRQATSGVRGHVLADDTVIGDTGTWGMPVSAVPVEAAMNIPVEGTAATTLAIHFSAAKTMPSEATFFYDHTDYQAHFTLSTLRPCEIDDPHPDCQ